MPSVFAIVMKPPHKSSMTKGLSSIHICDSRYGLHIRSNLLLRHKTNGIWHTLEIYWLNRLVPRGQRRWWIYTSAIELDTLDRKGHHLIAGWHLYLVLADRNIPTHVLQVSASDTSCICLLISFLDFPTTVKLNDPRPV